MTEEDLKISELGAYTNNSMNREGLKKLVEKVNSGGGTVDAYTKAETDALLADKADTDDVYTKTEVDTELADKQDVLTPGTNITIENNVISASGGGSSDWTLETNNTLSNFVDNNKSIKNILIRAIIDAGSGNYATAFMYIPKNNYIGFGSTVSLTTNSANRAELVSFKFGSIDGTKLGCIYDKIIFSRQSGETAFNISLSQGNNMTFRTTDQKQAGYIIYTKD